MGLARYYGWTLRDIRAMTVEEYNAAVAYANESEGDR